MKKLEMKPESLENVGTHNILKNTKGITLIALVITIIVLIILAGVTINTLTGDNGIITRAIQAKEETAKEEAKEEVNVAVAALQIERNITQMTQEEQRTFLENELKNIESTSSVETYGKGFIAKHKGYDFEISAKLAIVNVKETFNAEEWDKTACQESSFIWESDNPEDGEAYHTIIGYADGMQNEVKLKIPSRCHEIRCDSVYWDNQGRTFAKTLLELELPDTVTKIGDRAFSRFNLTSVTLPYSVTSIEDSAFENCTGLKSVTISDSVTNIGINAFSNCSNLTSIKMSDSVTNIGRRAFYNCIRLTSVTIPDSVTSIGEYAFDNCKGLTSVTIPDGLTSVEYATFIDCTSLISVTIPDSVTSIGKNAFSGCSNLTSLTIPDGVTSIGSYAFSGCSNLTSLTIPDSVTSIEYRCIFWHSTYLLQWYSNRISMGSTSYKLVNIE